MKKRRIWIFLLSFFVILYTPYVVHSVSLDNMIDEIEHLTAPHGYQADTFARQVLTGKADISFSGILSFLGELFFGELRQNISLIIKMAAAGLLSGVLVHFPEDGQKIGTFACALVLSLMALQSFSYAETVAEEAMDGLIMFVQGLLPTVGTAAVASGSVSGAGTVSAVFFAMQVFMQLLRRFMMPLTSVITVLAVCDGLDEGNCLGGVVSFLKQCFRWCTGLLLLLYGSAVGMTTGAAAIFDKTAGKTVKYAVGNLVPVIGGALADSLETVTTAAKAIRGALGVSGMVGIGAVAITPLMTLCALAFSYKLAATAVSVCGDKKTVALIEEIGGGMFRMLAIVFSSAVMFFISVAMLCFMGGAV